MERVTLRAAPTQEESLAELELLQFEQDLLRAKLADFEDQDLLLDHLQSELDAAAATIVELKFALSAAQRSVEQLTEQHQAEMHSIEAVRQALAEAQTALERSQADGAGKAQELAAARAESHALRAELKALKPARAEADVRLERLQTTLAQAEQAQQVLAGRLAESETGRLAAQAQQTALAASTEQLRSDKQALIEEREILELDLFGVLRKLGAYPQGALFRRVPGYRRLLERYRNKPGAP